MLLIDIDPIFYTKNNSSFLIHIDLLLPNVHFMLWINIDPILPNYHFMCLIDIDPLFRLFEKHIKRILGIFRAPPIPTFLTFGIPYMLRFPKLIPFENDSGFSLFGVSWSLQR